MYGYTKKIEWQKHKYYLFKCFQSEHYFKLVPDTSIIFRFFPKVQTAYGYFIFIEYFFF